MCGSIFLPCNTSYRSHQSRQDKASLVATVQEEMKLSWLADEKKLIASPKRLVPTWPRWAFLSIIYVWCFFNGVSTILTIKNMGISLLIGDYK